MKFSRSSFYRPVAAVLISRRHYLCGMLGFRPAAGGPAAAGVDFLVIMVSACCRAPRRNYGLFGGDAAGALFWVGLPGLTRMTSSSSLERHAHHSEFNFDRISTARRVTYRPRLTLRKACCRAACRAVQLSQGQPVRRADHDPDAYVGDRSPGRELC